MIPSETKRLTKVSKDLETLHNTLVEQAAHRCRELWEATPEDAVSREIKHLERALTELGQSQIAIRLLIAEIIENV